MADTHLGDAADDVRVLSGVVFLIPAEDLHLPAFQKIGLGQRGRGEGVRAQSPQEAPPFSLNPLSGGSSEGGLAQRPERTVSFQTASPTLILPVIPAPPLSIRTRVFLCDLSECCYAVTITLGFTVNIFTVLQPGSSALANEKNHPLHRCHFIRMLSQEIVVWGVTHI